MRRRQRKWVDAMARQTYVLLNDAIRARVHSAIDAAPEKTRIELRDPQRTLPQNSRFYAMLTDISDQAEHMGRKYDVGEWKAIILAALGREIRFLPSLDGTTFIPLGLSSSELSKEEMTDAIEFMFAEFIPRGVIFNEPAPKAEIRR